MDFWIEVAKTSPELGELAQLWWEKPISSAGVERIFSILTHMDDEHRRQMQDETLYNTLFLRANRKLVEQLVAERAAAERGFPGVGDAGAASRDAAAQVAGAAAVFSALGAPAGAACAKRERPAAREDPVASAAVGPSAAGAGLPPAAKRGRLGADAADSSAVVEEKEDALFTREGEESPGAGLVSAAAAASAAGGLLHGLPAAKAGAGSTSPPQEFPVCSDCTGVISPDGSCEPSCTAGLRRANEREDLLAAKRHDGFLATCIGQGRARSGGGSDGAGRSRK